MEWLLEVWNDNGTRFAFQAVMDGEVKKARHIVTVSGGVEYSSKITSRKVLISLPRINF